MAFSWSPSPRPWGERFYLTKLQYVSQWIRIVIVKRRPQPAERTLLMTWTQLPTCTCPLGYIRYYITSLNQQKSLILAGPNSRFWSVVTQVVESLPKNPEDTLGLLYLKSNSHGATYQKKESAPGLGSCVLMPEVLRAYKWVYGFGNMFWTREGLQNRQRHICQEQGVAGMSLFF